MSTPTLTPQAMEELKRHVTRILQHGQVYNSFRITPITLPNTTGGASGTAIQLIKNPLEGRLLMLIYNAGSGTITLTDSAQNQSGIVIPALGNASDKWGPGIDWFVFTTTTASVVVVEFA